jgi:hypothetical protein
MPRTEGENAVNIESLKERFVQIESTLEEIPRQLTKFRGEIQHEIQEVRAILIVGPDERHEPRKPPKSKIGKWYREAKEGIHAAAWLLGAVAWLVSKLIPNTAPTVDEIRALLEGQKQIAARVEKVEAATTGRQATEPPAPAAAAH